MVIHKAMMRSANEKSVLQAVYAAELISKSEIARQVELNKVTVSQIANKFLETGLLKEVGEGTSTQQGGRKPSLLEINKEYGFIVSVDLGYKMLSLMTMSINGEKLVSLDIRVANNQINEMLTVIMNFIDEQKEKQESNLLGISVAIHGIVKHNKIRYSPFIDMQNINLEKVLKYKYDVPVLLENEANLTAIYERDFSTGNIQNAVSISIHKGIGAGIIIEGKLHRGHNGEAGEIGQTVIFDRQGSSLLNDNKIEDYCSQDAVLEHIKKAKKLEYINLPLVKQMYENQDKVVLEILDNFCLDISRLVNNVIVSFDPDVVFMNANILKEIPNLLTKIRAPFEKGTLKNTPIILSNNVEYSTLYGGCAQIIIKVLGLTDLKLKFMVKEEI